MYFGPYSAIPYQGVAPSDGVPTVRLDDTRMPLFLRGQARIHRRAGRRDSYSISFRIDAMVTDHTANHHKFKTCAKVAAF
jgi:hypothetical protein